MVIYQREKAKLLTYTRKVSYRDYPDGLARSVHLAVSRDGEHWQAMHGNYGILFPEAELSSEDTIVPKCVANPRVFRLPEGDYAVLADRVNEDGSPESDGGRVVFWRTRDFRTFEKGVLLEKKGPEWEKLQKMDRGTTLGQWVVEGEPVEGAAMEIEPAMCDRIVQRWTQIHHVETRVPAAVYASEQEDVRAVKAEAVYSDGSAALKQVAWNMEKVDFCKPGRYTVTGTVCGRQFPFPLAKGYGDPVIFPWEGKWYFLSTSDNRKDIGIYVREAESVEALFAEGTQEHLILDVDEEKGFVQTFWAPEFHVIGGRLYILFAVGGKVWGPQCHLMGLKEGGRIVDAESWEEPVRVVCADGSPLGADGITLDMTYLKAGGRSYMVWSYRRHMGTPKDTGSMLYIAEAKEEEPWRLAGEPVLLSRPLFGWENVSGTINNEGPYGFVKDGKVYLTYSGGAANSYTYALGLLTAEESADLTDPCVWNKSAVPVLSFYSVKGEYGPGHNSFFVDSEGSLMIAYHGEMSLESTLRCDGIRRVHFDIEGEPVFDLSAERDLNPELWEVSMQVVVR
ncbi:MAG: family 43 glycosylhydrolase [Lachnospiraceae bacterium]|nr:family 43 glycosylhydrolase [uncultured Acetatifactor sp.]MCI8287227.1 family 43 glycosylhydrolase [Lachnospiraceae bacterium]